MELNNNTKLQELRNIKSYIHKNSLDTSSRKREKVYSRAYLYAYMHEILDLTLEDIGEMFGRDHSSVCHAINNIHDQYKDDLFYLHTIKEVKMEFPMDKYITDIKGKLYTNHQIMLDENAVIMLNLYKKVHKLSTDDEAINKILNNLTV